MASALMTWITNNQLLVLRNPLKACFLIFKGANSRLQFQVWRFNSVGKGPEWYWFISWYHINQVPYIMLVIPTMWKVDARGSEVPGHF